MSGFTDSDDLKQQVWEAWTPDERQAYIDAGPEVHAAAELAELVYNMRVNAGLSQAELARRIGAAQPYISSIEHGARVPTIPTLKKLAQATGNRLQVTTVPVARIG